MSDLFRRLFTPAVSLNLEALDARDMPNTFSGSNFAFGAA
jgi:hypothetical protein